ncbi:hypothetical protein [Crocosphaera subtropica]|nr:hypothetical protein [Crocosphaera subtropica]
MNQRELSEKEFNQYHDLNKVKESLKLFVKHNSIFENSYQDEDEIWRDYKTNIESLEIEEISIEYKEESAECTAAFQPEVTSGWVGGNINYNDITCYDFVASFSVDLTIEFDYYLGPNYTQKASFKKNSKDSVTVCFTFDEDFDFKLEWWEFENSYLGDPEYEKAYDLLVDWLSFSTS